MLCLTEWVMLKLHRFNLFCEGCLLLRICCRVLTWCASSNTFVVDLLSICWRFTASCTINTQQIRNKSTNGWNLGISNDMCVCVCVNFIATLAKVTKWANLLACISHHQLFYWRIQEYNVMILSLYLREVIVKTDVLPSCSHTTYNISLY